MLFPFTHSWTRRQKSLIVAATVASLVVTTLFVYRFERDGRPSDSLFYGAWRCVSENTDDGVLWQFRSDHTFSSFILSRYDGEKLPFLEGRWYAGGRFLYLRTTPPLTWRNIVVLRFDVSPDRLTINLPHSRDTLWSLKRVQ
jgi:hypothetical protein